MNYTAHAVIGVEIQYDKLFRVEKRWHNKHIVPEGASYCPICGEPVYTLESVAVYDEDTCAIGPFKLRESWDEERVVLGYGAEERDFYYRENEKYGRFVPLPNIEWEKQSLREHLEPLGLWDESRFGLHAVLTIS